MTPSSSRLALVLTCALLQAFWPVQAQTPSLNNRIQVLPQVVPEAIKIIPTNPAKPSSSWGTAFVIAPNYLLTAYHVVHQRKQLHVGPVSMTATGSRWLSAELVKTDPENDLALLKISESLPAFKINPATTIPIGLEAYVIGYPQPRIQGGSRKITSGIVNGYRNTRLSRPDSGMLQISAEVSQGNSGGPVLAPDGTVIGMVQKKINATKVAERTQDLLINVNYALRSSEIVEFLRAADVPFQTQSLNLNQALRPYQLFDLHQGSVFAVIGRGQISDTPPTDNELPKDAP